ncbi:MAG: aminotransferase class I/II-fold pyridoxal phosphate-dependent enzyme [Phyllobacteriaceae bacterium]|nr:aminotransferase class I/II-fold pyridoxal phosphate-dependent enzyme [Phyllobacteriaceae bacterium]
MTLRRAIVLAAGFGARLHPLTQDRPKPLARVGGESILSRLVANLKTVGIERVVVVVGHLGEKIAAELPAAHPDVDFVFVTNDRYRTTGNLYSLWLARDHFDEDFLLLEADVVCRPEVLRPLVEAPPASCAALVSPRAWFMDGACVELCGVPPHITAPRQIPAGEHRSTHYKTVNFYRLAADFARGWLTERLGAEIATPRVGAFYETLFAEAIDRRVRGFLACVVPDADWFEIDTLDDLDVAEFRLMSTDDRLAHLNRLHGGHWRYPIVDHCLLYNFHYPPKKILDHMVERLPHLVREYPCAQRPIAEFVARWYDVDPARLIVANGVGELIPLVLADVHRPVVIPTPSFNEYEAVVDPALLHRLPLRAAEHFRLDPDRVIEMLRATGAGTLVLVSPNNPTGNAVPRADLVRIVTEAGALGVRVILDESFVDFQAEGRAASLMDELDRHPNLVVLFSLGKSHGVGGLRIGLLASADTEEVARLRRRLPLWNVNAFAEAYLRLFNAYRQEYFASCALVRHETQVLARGLADVAGLTVHPTDANFVLCRLDHAVGTAPDLVRRLLATEGILIKDCSGKTMEEAGQYLRISSRGGADDARLCRALARVVAAMRRTPALAPAE